MAAQVAVVNSGGANIASLIYAFRRIGVEARLCSESESIRKASHVVLPGVGAASDAMSRLGESGITSVIRELRQPVLGICLGMQLLAAASDEESTECLGIVDARAAVLPASPQSPVPHMGWSRISIHREHALLNGIDDGSYFYFLHSYALPPDGHTLATAMHGTEFCAILQKRNFFAAQFHPERSAAAGSRLLQNFMALN